MSDENNLSKMTNDEVREILKNMISPNSDKFEIDSKLIDKFSHRENKKEKLFAERLKGLMSFDHSDLRLNVIDDYSKDFDGYILAICANDHVEFILKRWIPKFRYFRNMIFVVNHESIHAVIDRILLEDEFDLFEIEGEYPFYAEGIDGLVGAPPIHHVLSWFLDTDGKKNTKQMFPDYFEEDSKDRIYDL